MALHPIQKSEIVAKFQQKPGDTGSSEVQIALLTERITGLQDHFKTHAKDHASRRGLLKMVASRRSLLDYLRRTNIERYRAVVAALNLRKLVVPFGDCADPVEGPCSPATPQRLRARGNGERARYLTNGRAQSPSLLCGSQLVVRRWWSDVGGALFAVRRLVVFPFSSPAVRISSSSFRAVE
jgi:small subunit ribosomal protein S15